MSTSSSLRNTPYCKIVPCESDRSSISSLHPTLPWPLVGKAVLQLSENNKSLFSGNYDFFCANFLKALCRCLLLWSSWRTLAVRRLCLFLTLRKWSFIKTAAEAILACKTVMMITCYNNATMHLSNAMPFLSIFLALSSLSGRVPYNPVVGLWGLRSHPSLIFYSTSNRRRQMENGRLAVFSSTQFF